MLDKFTLLSLFWEGVKVVKGAKTLFHTLGRTESERGNEGSIEREVEMVAGNQEEILLSKQFPNRDGLT